MEIPPLDEFHEHSTTRCKSSPCVFLCNIEMHCGILHPELDSLSHFSMWVPVAGAQFAFNSLALPL